MYLVNNWDLNKLPNGHKYFQAEDIGPELLDACYRGHVDIFTCEGGRFRKVKVDLAKPEVVDLAD